MSKIGRYVHVGDGWVLLDESGACRGRLLELDRQILGSTQKRLYEPTGWFKLDGWKVGKRESRSEIA